VEAGGGSLAAKQSDLAASEFNFLWEGKNKDSRNRSTLARSISKKNLIFSVIAMTPSEGAKSPTPAAAVSS
jgi:hypothetical protein